MELLQYIKPKYWFSAHLHTKFPALFQHEDDKTDVKVTKFLALDKCLPKRKFLQVVDVPSNDNVDFKYDLEWLTILYLTNHLTSVKYNAQYMPGPGSEGRYGLLYTIKLFKFKHFGNFLDGCLLLQKMKQKKFWRNLITI